MHPGCLQSKQAVLAYSRLLPDTSLACGAGCAGRVACWCWHCRLASFGLAACLAKPHERTWSMRLTVSLLRLLTHRQQVLETIFTHTCIPKQHRLKRRPFGSTVLDLPLAHSMAKCALRNSLLNARVAHVHMPIEPFPDAGEAHRGHPNGWQPGAEGTASTTEARCGAVQS